MTGGATGEIWTWSLSGVKGLKSSRRIVISSMYGDRIPRMYCQTDGVPFVQRGKGQEVLLLLK